LLLLIGLLTNFNVDVDEEVLWTPVGTKPLEHGEWIENDSGYNAAPRDFFMLIHRSGANVLGREGVNRCFEALNVLRNTPGYHQLCQSAEHIDFNRNATCLIYAVTSFWNDTRAFFDESVSSDQQAIATMSSPVFPNGAPVDIDTILGRVVRDNDSGLLVSAESYAVLVRLPGEDATKDLAEDVEKKALDALLDMRDAWLAEEGNDFALQAFGTRSFADEFTRAILNNIPLIPIVFVIMSIFTCCIFWKRDWVYSRSLLGFGAVVGVLLAILSGFGLMFMIGVPFTSMTQILPFIMFGKSYERRSAKR
jgi:Niemann-Pick C1 protein